MTILTIPSAPFASGLHPPLFSRSRIPRPVSPSPRPFSPPASFLHQTPPIASSTPYRPTSLQFTPSPSSPPQTRPRRTFTDSSAQTPYERLTLQERFPELIIPPSPEETASYFPPRDSRLRAKPKKNLVFQP